MEKAGINTRKRSRRRATEMEPILLSCTEGRIVHFPLVVMISFFRGVHSFSTPLLSAITEALGVSLKNSLCPSLTQNPDSSECAANILGV